MSLIPDSVIALNERVPRLLYSLSSSIFILMMMITMMILLFMMLYRRFEATLKLKQHVVFCFQRLNVELNHPQTLSDLFSALQRSAGVSTLIFQTFIAFSSNPF